MLISIRIQTAITMMKKTTMPPMVVVMGTRVHVRSLSCTNWLSANTEKITERTKMMLSERNSPEKRATTACTSSGREVSAPGMLNAM